MFSIGETAKLNNITVQTLRHYDKEGILKPFYIDKENGYRYYTITQFLQIDFIRRYRTLGFSIKEIQKILSSENSIDSILNSISFQKKIITHEIDRLKKIEQTLNIMESSISNGKTNLSKGVFFQNTSFFLLESYKGDIHSIDDIEFALRKVFKKIKVNFSISDTLVILKADKNRFIKTKEIIYTELILASKTKKTNASLTLKGASIHVESAVFENSTHYDNLIHYGKKKNFNCENYFYEIYYISKLNNENKEYSLINIFLPTKNI